MRDDGSTTEVDELALLDELADELGLPRRALPVRRVAHRGPTTVSGLQWGTGRPGTVLLHGGSLNAHAWDALLLRYPTDALALDLPGHGHSGWFDDGLYLPEPLAAAVAPAIESLAATPVTLVGHSMGGLTALTLAATRPDLVDRLVLVDATPGSTPERSQALLDFVTARDFPSFDAMLDHVAAFKPNRRRRSLRRSLLLNAVPTGGGRWTWRHDGARLTGAERWARTFEALPQGWTHAAGVRCPTLLVRGGRSPIVLRSDVERYRALIADLHVVEIAGAGHNIHGDRPAELGAAITAFLQDTGAEPCTT